MRMPTPKMPSGKAMGNILLIGLIILVVYVMFSGKMSFVKVKGGGGSCPPCPGQAPAVEGEDPSSAGRVSLVKRKKPPP